MPTDPSDGELARKLRRRAESVALPADWAERQLLPSVRSRIEAGARTTSRAGLAPLAGLAGLAAVVLLLVVALPRLSPASDGGESPSAAATDLAASSTSPTATDEPGATVGPSSAPTAQPSAMPTAEPSEGATPGRSPAVVACARGPQPPESDAALNVTVRDASGLVTGCTALPGYPDDVSTDDILAARPYVRDPGDGLRLDAMFFGTPCDENATVDVSGTGSALSVAIALTDVYSGCWTALAYHWVSIEFSEPVRADAVVASLHSVSAPTGSLAPDDRQAGPAVWQLAPGERPTANSRSFDVVVFEEECAGGESPEGRVVGPTVEYRSDAVVVSFGVTRLPGAGDCPTAPGAPFTVQLSEPVGERILIDAGGSRPVERVAFDDGLLVHTWRFPDELAAGRLAGFLGPDACTQTVHHDREVGQQHFEQWAGQVEGDGGYALDGTAWLGDWRAAARAFEAFEVYATPDGRERWIIAVASGQEWLGGGEDGALAAEFPYGALVVADLYRADVSGARTLWLPAFTGHTSGTPNCTSGAGNWPDPAPGPGAHTEAVAGDFRLGISSGRVTYEAGEPIDVEADLTYSGSAEAVTVHAGGGLLEFGFEQLDGDLEMSPAAVALGKDFELARGRAFVRQYSKSGGWSNDDPNADFYADFIADPQFRLPRGIWRVYVWAQFFVGPDDQEVTLTSSIVITTR